MENPKESATSNLNDDSVEPQAEAFAMPEGDEAPERDPFAGNAEEVAAQDTREKAEQLKWAESVLGLSASELEVELHEAARRFKIPVGTLRRIVTACRDEMRKKSEVRQRPTDQPEEGVRFYGYDNEFKVSSQGVFARRSDGDGDPYWEQISTTPIEPEALTRDARGENWGTYVTITNRDGVVKRRAIPHALIAANKDGDIAANLASIGVGVIVGRSARQGLVQFLTIEVPARITAVPQVGWHESDGTWVFVLPDETLTPTGFNGARPVLQTTSVACETHIFSRLPALRGGTGGTGGTRRGFGRRGTARWDRGYRPPE